jgi:hypothetical protein
MLKVAKHNRFDTLLQVVANSKIPGACGPGMRLAFFHVFFPLVRFQTRALTRLMILHWNKVGVVWTMQVSLLQDLADT